MLQMSHSTITSISKAPLAGGEREAAKLQPREGTQVLHRTVRYCIEQEIYNNEPESTEWNRSL